MKVYKVKWGSIVEYVLAESSSEAKRSFSEAYRPSVEDKVTTREHTPQLFLT